MVFTWRQRTDSRARNYTQIIGQNYHFEIVWVEFSRWNFQYLFQSMHASKLKEHVKQRYLQKIQSIGVDPALIEGKHFEPVNPIVYMQPVESINFYFTWFSKQASTCNNNLKPSSADKPIIKWFQGLLRVYKVMFLPTSLLLRSRMYKNEK